MGLNAAQRAATIRRGGVTYGSANVQAQVFWDDSPLKAAGVRAFVTAGRQARDVAKAGSHSSRVARSTSVRFFSGGAATGMDIAGIIRAANPLAHLFELGTKPHAIAPKGSIIGVTTARGTLSKRRRGASSKARIAMKFPDGGFARGVVRHPGMEAKPFLRPAAAAFPALYNRALSSELRY